jgi:hypothetical protein
VQAVTPGVYAPPIRLMAACGDIKVSQAAFQECVRLYPNEQWMLYWRGKTVGEWYSGKGGRILSGYGA